MTSDCINLIVQRCSYIYIYNVGEISILSFLFCFDLIWLKISKKKKKENFCKCMYTRSFIL